MASKVQICNMALSHLSVGKEISNLLTESSEEARACRAFYETARDATLRDFPWPFATKFADLGLVEEDPTTEWGYSYRYPSDCVEIRRILSGSRNDTRDTRVPYKIGQDADGGLIYTDQFEAQGEFTVRTDAADRYPPDFALAFSYRLAMYLTPRLAKGKPTEVAAEIRQLYMAHLEQARATAFNEEQADDTPDAELIRARN